MALFPLSCALPSTGVALWAACLASTVCISCSKDNSLAPSVANDEAEADAEAEPRGPAPTAGADAGPHSTEDLPADATGVTPLPGQHFVFDLAERVYVNLSTPRVLQPENNNSLAWDLLFDGFTLYTNSGAVGPGLGASFGPSSELDLLFDAAPAVPLRADQAENAMLNWYWFGPDGITSRFHTYGVRDEAGRLFKVQVLSYYTDVDGVPRTGMYTLRYAEVTEGETEEPRELTKIDASSGGVTLPPNSPAGCVDLSTGAVLALSKAQWTTRTDWDLCFQRTEVFLNGGLSGPGQIAVVDLDSVGGADAGVTSEEMERTAATSLPAFEQIDNTTLTQPDLPWDREYQALPRIGTRWLTGSLDQPEVAPGSWIVRGADGQAHFALFFTDIKAASNGLRSVTLQVKPLTPPLPTE